MAASKEQKRQVLELYLEGRGFLSIGKFLNFTHIAVYHWIRAFGEKLDKTKSAQEIKVVEIDEMHSDVSRKKDGWIWIAVDRYGRKFIDCVTGKREIKTGKTLLNSLENKELEQVRKNAKIFHEATDDKVEWRALYIKLTMPFLLRGRNRTPAFFSYLFSLESPPPGASHPKVENASTASRCFRKSSALSYFKLTAKPLL